MTGRRGFIALLAFAPFAARAQGGKTKKVVVLFAGNPETGEPATAPFFRELQRAGWVEGRNIIYEHLLAGGSREKICVSPRSTAWRYPNFFLGGPTG